MLIGKWHLIVHVISLGNAQFNHGYLSRKKWAMIYIHNAVKKMHKRNWGHHFNHGNLKSSHWWQNRYQFWQHISSHVKFEITYYHYYQICFTHLSIITGVVWLYMDEVKLNIHVIYILWLNLFYVLFAVPIVSHIVFVSVGRQFFWKLMLFVDCNRHETKFIVSYIIYL